MRKPRQRGSRLPWISVVLSVSLALLLASCAPAAAPTPTPTKAPVPVVAPSPAPPKTEAATPAPPKAAVATPTAPAKPLARIKIPVLAILTGPGAGFGALVKLGAKLAEEDINKAGGINGHSVEMVFYDSALNPQETVTVIRTASERDKGFAFVGPLAGSETDVAIPLANELKIPMISYALIYAGSPPHLPWVFRVGPNDDTEVATLISAFKKKYPQAKKILIAGDVKEKSPEFWVKQLLPQNLRKEGYEIVDTVGWESGTTDFGAIVSKIKDLKPEGIALAVGSRGGSVEVAKELTRQGVKVPVMGSPHFALGGFIQRGGADMEGWIMSWSVDMNRPDLKEVNTRLEAMAGTEPSVAKPYQPGLEYQVYDSIMMLAKVMREQNITADMDPVRARTLIAEGYRKIKDYNGLLGKLSIGPTQDAEFTPAALIVKGGFLRTID
ncbi:MAG TPA: ABC transporter substrate-binding protein [Dehalococcoidia bacterium]|nr:ABC transporter substrate-binding protein [Dehalococcoidia bacterium]